MRTVRPIVLTAMAIATLATAFGETRSMDSYQSIVDRNPFGLKPPPVVVPPKEPEAPPTPKTEFYLAGITTVGYPKRPKAYLVNKDAGKKGDEKYYTLSMNERSGDLTLTDIDVKQRKVKIQYRGEDLWLSMKENGVPASAVPQPPPGVIAGVPGAAGHMNPPGGVPLPGGGNPGVAPAPNGQPNLYPSSSINNRRMPRTGNMGMNVPGAAQAPAAQVTEAPIDPAEQYVRMKFNEALNKQKGIDAPPMPPIPGL